MLTSRQPDSEGMRGLQSEENLMTHKCEEPGHSHGINTGELNLLSVAQRVLDRHYLDTNVQGKGVQQDWSVPL